MTFSFRTKLASLILTLALAALFPGSLESSEDNLLSPENAYRFAQHLFSEQEYLRAAVEFQRYVYSTEIPPAKLDSALFQTGVCYRLGGDFEKAITYFGKISVESPQSPLVGECYYQVSLCHLMAGQDSAAVSTATRRLSLEEGPETRLELQKVISLSHLRSRRWGSALALSDSLSNIFPEDTLLASARLLAQEGQNLPSKSSLVAGISSAVIPGAGRFYAGRPTDGVFSFLAVGLTSWQAYEAFDEYGSASVKGWVYGSIASVFYLGNIYGSAVAARIFNEEQNVRLSDKVEALIDAQSR